MAKVIKLKTNEDNIQDFLDDIKEYVKENEIDNLLITGKLPDKSVFVAYTKNLNWYDKQELNSHIQINIINDMIKENYITD